MPIAKGTRLDSYEIVAPLGAGGMGEVYRARDASLKREVAIKVLPAHWLSDPDRLRRFELEAQSTAALNHPNIISIFHVGEYDGAPYIVTELLPGETLRDRLRRGPMRLREVLDIGIDIARGLAAAHDAGIVHRDLKPENLFLTKDGRAKILDFGLAKLAGAQAECADGATVTLCVETSPGQVLGTVGYMSPEQVRGKAADGRSDIFAVGVVLYEMLTGQRAFQKATSAETMTAILNEDPPAVSQIAPSLPPGVPRIVIRCLAKSPEQRFQHSSDLAFALEALSDSSSAAMPTVRQTIGVNKNWLWAASAGLILAIAAALFLWSKIPAPSPVLESVTQLTDDGEPKQGRLVTDGARIYFNEGSSGSFKIAQVAVTGGPTAVIPTRFANPQIAGMTREGSALLTIPEAVLGFPGALWTIPLPAGEPLRLGAMEAKDADFSPGGDIVLTLGNDLYVGQKYGSNVRKLVSMVGNNVSVLTEPTVSPDGRRIVFTASSGWSMSALFEANLDGSGVRPLLNSLQNPGVCCAKWTPDGEYLVFSSRREGISDLYTLTAKSGRFRPSQEPFRLTSGPLSYSGMVPSRDGKRIFAIGTMRRGELVRYDGKSKQFLPFLSGISAIDPTFSADGKWVTYTAYPDHNLWRSRVDGTERMQLTYPPMEVTYPFISPDGKRVAFGTTLGEIYVVGLDGGTPRRIVGKDGATATWSPDGNLLAVVSFNGNYSALAIYDLRNGSLSSLPSTQGLAGAVWLTQETLVAAIQNPMRLVSLDLRTLKRSDLISDAVVNWAMSPDYKYLYYATGGAEPETLRMRVADHKVETIMNFKDLLRVTDWGERNTQINVAPDGSAVFTRDKGTQEIYALTVKWP